LLELDDRGPFDWGLFKKLLSFCREQRVAIWHGHDYKSNLIGLWVRRYWPMKLVTTVHGWVKFTWRTPLYYAIDRLCLRWYDRVICVSDDLHEACLKAGVRQQRCTWIENAIDTHQFIRRLNVQEAKVKLGFDPRRKLIGAVGRLSKEKGFEVLIRAVAGLRPDGQEIDLVIIGDGDQKQALASQIASLGLEHRVKLLGFRPDTIDLFQAFDVFALSSYREGLPNVILEAMAMETPVVATAVAGIPKVITDGVDGLLVKPGDVTALRNSLELLSTDGALAHRLTANARETIERRFSFQRRMQKVANVYDELMN
jgi:glycosyltransferase involved in cell wall biosynthesis